jgi:hypothetical protein
MSLLLLLKRLTAQGKLVIGVSMSYLAELCTRFDSTTPLKLQFSAALLALAQAKGLNQWTSTANNVFVFTGLYNTDQRTPEHDECTLL